MYFHVTLAQRI